jgi:hypothetical protein
MAELSPFQRSTALFIDPFSWLDRTRIPGLPPQTAAAAELRPSADGFSPCVTCGDPGPDPTPDPDVPSDDP